MPRQGWGTKPSRSNKLHLADNESCRIAILDPEPEHQRCHYLNRYYLCLGDAGCPFCDAGIPDKPRWAVYVFRYNPGVGNPPEAGQPATPFGGQVIPWVLGMDKYKVLHALHGQGMALTDVDFFLTCKDAKYQDFSIMMLGPAYYRTDPAMAAQVGEIYQKQNPDLSKEMGMLVPAERALLIVQQDEARFNILWSNIQTMLPNGS